MIKIISKFEVNGVEYKAYLFKAPKFEGGPTQWVTTKIEPQILINNAIFLWNEDKNELTYDPDPFTIETLDSIARGIFCACAEEGITVH